MRLIGPVSTMDRYTAPAMRAAFLVGCMNFSFVSRSADESNWSSVAMQPDCCGEECGGKCQPDPEAGRAQKFSRSQLHHQRDISFRDAGEGLLGEHDFPIFQEQSYVRSDCL